MRLAVDRGGGIAGLVRRTEISGEALPPGDAQRLREQVQRSGLSEVAEPAPGERLPDETLYAITLEDAGRERTVRFSETQLPDALRDLIAWVDGRPERSEEIVPPGR